VSNEPVGGFESVGAFAPGRINLIGEHTDYNHGLALPFAIEAGTVVQARPNHERRVRVHALDLGEHDEFDLVRPARADGWRAFARGAVAELRATGHPLVGAEISIEGTVPRGAGLSSSASLEVALCLALLATIGVQEPDPLFLARLCSHVENEWVGARTGLLDQIACLCSEAGGALLIDFQTFELRPVPLRLPDGWRLVTLDSGESHSNAGSSYNRRREECVEACALLGIGSLRQATWERVERLPEQLRRRAEHVLSENQRVLAAETALRSGDLRTLGELLDASHESLRDNYEVSTPAVEAAVERLRSAGAVGARIMGGGFGGHVLGLLPPEAEPPAQARVAHAGPGAHLV
jgi:galactokinase